MSIFQARSGVQPAFCVLLFIFGFLTPVSDLRGNDEIPCATLLSTPELTSASGVSFQLTESKAANPDRDSEAHSSCTWRSSEAGSEATITVEFWDRAAIVKDPFGGGTIRGFFDMFVSSRQVISDAEPETLEGIGVRSVLYAETDPIGESFTVLIELSHGMAYIRARELSREQVEAIARVVDATKKR